MTKTLNNSFNQSNSFETSGKQPQQAISSIPQQMTLPKGGGAIKGIGEKLSTNPLTGTATISIPIFTTPSRWDFYPKLSVTYDSGNGNGIFGLGWDISIPSISRKTEKELPKYWDEENSDTFILSGAEDLVPVLDKNNDWKEVVTEREIVTDDATEIYVIQQFRPRIEGLFARIEKWKSKTEKVDVYWRTISKDNVTTIYGKSVECRISDPGDGSRIFKWLIEKSFDDKGNVIFYQYKQENQENIDHNLLQESNRLLNDKSFGNKYLKRIKYCNKEPYNNHEKPESENYECLLEVIFDYGEHDVKNKVVKETKKWPCRPDAFSSYRAGFEIRTYRLCHHVLMVHHFKELGDTPCLVRSTDFKYKEDPISSFLISVQQTGYIRVSEDNYREKSIPPVEFTYTKQEIDDEIHTVGQKSIENLPIGLDGRQYRWLDLNSEGLPGILTEQADGGWFYKQNLGNGTFAPMQSVAPKPSLSNLQGGRQEIMDLADDGEKYLVQFSEPLEGFYRLNTEKSQWEQFTPFASTLNINWNDPNLRFIDLNGDGFADILISENDAYVMHLSKSTEGFSFSQVIHKLGDEEKGPELVFADPTESIYLADISGDGQTDIVRIRNGEVCYWPNLGYGHFGAKVTMGNAPIFDHPDQFEQSRIRLADTDGSGVTDIIYLGRDGVQFWLNQSGNSWSEEYKLARFPRIDNLSSVMVLDLLGTGTSCIVWSSPLPGDTRNPLQYIDLMAGIQQLTKQKQKPHLLESIKNNMGAETRIQYCASTKFYLEDLEKGKPWITKLPFPVHVVERVETFDYLTHTKLVSLAEYHHGYYDRDDREFRGFGLVEQWDTESFEQFKQTGLFSDKGVENIQDDGEGLHVPPVYTKTWFHTGFHLEGHRISKHFEKEYYSEKNEKWKDILKDDILLEDTLLPDEELTFKEENEACRALKGQILRQEIYACDNSDKSEHPYTVYERNYHLKLIQPIEHSNRHAVFYQCEHEVVDIYYERNPRDPRIQHRSVLKVDDYGNIERQATVYYPRLENNQNQKEVYPEQLELKVDINLIDYTNLIDELDSWLIPIPWQTRSFEMRDVPLPGTNNLVYLHFKEIEDIAKDAIDNTNNIVEYGTDKLDVGKARLFHWDRKYFVDIEGNVLAAGSISMPVLLQNTEVAVFPSTYINRIYQDKVTDGMLHDEGGYYKDLDSGYWWNPGIRQRYLSANQFYLPNITYLPTPLDLGKFSIMFYDEPYNLIPIKFKDPKDNEIKSEINYRVLLPKEVTDMNDNHSQVIYDELGMVFASSVFGNESGVITGDGNIIIDGFQAFQDANLSNILANPQKFIQNATLFFFYDHFSWLRNRLPPYIVTVLRERHLSENNLVSPPPNHEARFQFMILYSDGLGRELQKKLKVEEGPAWVQQPNGFYKEENVVERWLASGRTVYNNKGKPIKQYEPFYSFLPNYEEEKSLVEFGVTSTIHYDPLERVIRTDTPKGFFLSTIFDPWMQQIFDENDNVKESSFYNDLINYNKYPDIWTADRIKAEKEALLNTVSHAGTPNTIHLNNMGQKFLEMNLVDGNKLFTYYDLDIKGNKISIVDPRQFVKNQARELADKPKVKSFQFLYDMQNSNLASNSMDAGINVMLKNAVGNIIYSWTANAFIIKTKYDELQRPKLVEVKGNSLDNSVEKIEYGESIIDIQTAKDNNLRGKPIRHYDQAGIKHYVAYNIEGQNTNLIRKLRGEYKKEIDWKTEPEPQDEFLTITIYDALGRLISRRQSDSSTHQYNYHQSGLLKSLKAELTPNTGFKEYVNEIQYNARGQRTLIRYGNGTITTYEYEKDTFRLESLKTHRSIDDSNKLKQDISYVYDPIGNITQITDNGHRLVFKDGEMVKPTSKYDYDSLYHLRHAEGRQHSAIMPDDYKKSDTFKQSRYLSFDALINDPNLLENYEENYEYDFAGNLEKIKHSVPSNSSRSWTRIQIFADDSNRIMSSQIGQQVKDDYSFDLAGNIKQLEHLKEVNYNYRNNVSSAVLLKHPGDLSDSEYYVYDSNGMRVRKVMERHVKSNAEFKFLDIEEKIFLDGYEIKRNKRINLEDSSSEVLLERFSCHLMDDKKRIAIVHKWNIDVNNRETDNLGIVKTHYLLGNHLDSCLLELDDNEQVISYEEYYPYGGTSFIAGKSQSSPLAKEVSNKDYRYTGKERDDSTGLYYHGARYYIPWLERWASCDPAGSTDILNLYIYARDNPLIFFDPNGAEDEYGPESLGLAGIGEGGGGFINTSHFRSQMPERLPVRTGTTTVQHIRPEKSANVQSAAQKSYPQGLDLIAGVGTALAETGAGALMFVSDVAGVALGDKSWKEPIKGIIETSDALVTRASNPFEAAVLSMQSVNPFFHIFVNAGKTGQALEQGNYLEAGRSGMHTAISALTLGLFRNRKSTLPNTASAKSPTSTLNTEIEAAIDVSRASVMVQMPAKNLAPKTKPYGKGGQYTEYKFDAKTSVSGATGDVRTTLKIHDADPTAPPNSNSATGTTIAIEQGKGNRRVVPDPNSDWGGRWVDESTATPEEWNASHIPVFR